jgi:hypothetical protein
LDFSRYDWTVRQVRGYPSAQRKDYEAANAWVDSQGFLHLRLQKTPAGWTSAEVSLSQSLGYGLYRFALRDISCLEPPVVLAISVWDGSGRFQEMDVEISRWGELNSQNMQVGDEKRSRDQEAAHLSLELGRLLFANGADTAHVIAAIGCLASGLDFRANLLITYEALLVTVDTGNAPYTQAGRRLLPAVVDMTAVENLNQISDEMADRSIDRNAVHQRLARLEQNIPLYSSWLIAPMLGLSAASLSRLFGGDWSVFAVVLIAATAGTLLRMQLSRRQV